MELIREKNLNASKGSLSEMLFDFQWSKYFPITVGEYAIELSTAKENLDFIVQQKNDLFVGNQRLYKEELSAPKMRFYVDYADHFKFTKNGKMIGVYITNPIDWATFYIRFGMIETEHQGKGLQTAILEHFKKILPAYKVGRMEAEVAISKKSQMLTFLKHGWIVAGTVNHEVYGTMARLVYFLSQDRKENFYDSFCFNELVHGGLSHLVNIKEG